MKHLNWIFLFSLFLFVNAFASEDILCKKILNEDDQTSLKEIDKLAEEIKCNERKLFFKQPKLSISDSLKKTSILT